MKKVFLCVMLALGIILITSPAQALSLLSEDFSSATIHDNLTINLISSPAPGNVNLGKWIDFPNTLRWGIASDGGPSGAGDAYAQHLLQTSDSTNLLFYGIDLTAIGALATFSLDFDYVASNRKPQVILAGMLNGLHSLDPYAPWFSGDPDDGIVILDQSLDTTSAWVQDMHFEGAVPQYFDALAIGFIMGGTDGSRGVDNIELNVAPVPEPATMLLLGSGLLGLAALRRKFRKR